MLHALRINRGRFLIDSEGNQKSKYGFVSFSGSSSETLSLRCQLDRAVRCRVDEPFGLEAGHDSSNRHMADAKVNRQITNTACA